MAGKKTIVVKIGTSSLTEKSGRLSPARLRALTAQVADLRDEGRQVVMVPRAAIAAGYTLLGYHERPVAVAAKQACAAGGQGLLMEEYTRALQERGYVAAQLLLTRDDFRARRRYHNAFSALEVLLARGAVPIINENDTVSIAELKLGDNDMLSAQVAAMLHAELLVLLTDTDGLYTADPRKVKNARKLDEITYDEMLELASLGAQVLMNRSVELAKRYGVVIEVLSSYVRKPGTKVKEVAKKMEEMKISGIAKDNDVARIAVVGVPDEPGIAFRVFNTMARSKINVDIILQSYGKKGTNDISFTVPLQDADAAAEALSELQESIGFDHLSVDTNVCKVSIVGAGMMSASGIAALMFEALYDAKINIQMISTSEIKVSVLIEKGYADQAVQAIHNKFFG